MGGGDLTGDAGSKGEGGGGLGGSDGDVGGGASGGGLQAMW